MSELEEAEMLALVIAGFKGDVDKNKVYAYYGPKGHHALALHLIRLGWRKHD